NVKDAMDEHQHEKQREIFRKAERQNGDTADKVTEREEFFGGEVAIGKLVAEEHADDGSDGKGIENERLLSGREPQAWQVTIDEGKPGAPNEKFQDHHQEQPQAQGGIHSYAGSSLG